MERHEFVRILGEDGPPGECTDLIIHLGGNYDFYIGTEGPDPHGASAAARVRSPMARFSTSGGRCDPATTLVAMLGAVAKGDYESAVGMLDSLRSHLTQEHAYRPDPEEAEAKVREAIKRARTRGW